MDNLAVDNRFLKPRKSVIGKLERSSFQAQRLSDVGVAFSQQITAKVGLKLPASQERIVEQTRWLYLRYVFVKLRQNKLPLRDLNLTKSSRARRAAALGVNGGIGGTDGAQIVVSISEPSSANADITYADGPLFGRQTNLRSRPALSTQIDSQELNMLAARMSLLKSNNKRTDRSHHHHLTSLANGGTRNMFEPGAGTGAYSGSFASSTTINATNELMATAANVTKKFIMDPTINNQIFTVIMNTITELRESKPEFYSDTIYEVIGIDKFSSLDSLLEVQKTICQEMTRTDISWDRIIALFSLFGAMSLDCVRLGAPEHVGPILDGFVGFVERDLALWISQQGGWESFLYKCRTGCRFGPIYKAMVIVLPLVIWTIFFAFK